MAREAIRPWRRPRAVRRYGYRPPDRRLRPKAAAAVPAGDAGNFRGVMAAAPRDYPAACPARPESAGADRSANNLWPAKRSRQNPYMTAPEFRDTPPPDR